MIPNHAQFIQAVQEKKKVWVKFFSRADNGVLEHACAPLEYGLGQDNADGLNRYWLWDYSSITGSQRFGLLPQQIVGLSVLGEVFDPSEFAVVPSLTQTAPPGLPSATAAPIER